MFMRRVRMMGGGGGARPPRSNEDYAEECGIGIKKGAIIQNLMPGLVDKFPDIAKVWEKYNETPIITSGNDPDPNRVKDSDHEIDMAIDLRARYYSDEKQDQMAEDLKKALGPDYYVLSEHPKDRHGNRVEERDHIHISYRPRITISFPSVNV